MLQEGTCGTTAGEVGSSFTWALSEHPKSSIRGRLFSASILDPQLSCLASGMRTPLAAVGLASFLRNLR